MILVLAGTTEGPEIVGRIGEMSLPVTASVATPVGKAAFDDAGLGDKCRVGRLDADELEGLLRSEAVTLLIDATHPYAAEASRNAIAAAAAAGVDYLRYERSKTDLPASPSIHHVDGAESAASLCGSIGRRALLTSGLTGVAAFAPVSSIELFVRVLPVRESIERLIELGIPPSNIIAMQGPFSVDFNRALIRELQIDVLVTKDSGAEGGVMEKVEAASAENAAIVVIDRPTIDYPEVVSSIDEVLEKICCRKASAECTK